jgi:hypothetical protein
MWHVWQTGEMNTGIWWRDLRERDSFEDLDIDGWIISQRIFKKWDGEAWTGLIWLRIGRASGIL